MNPLLKSSLDIKAIELLEIPTEDKNDIKDEDWKKIKDLQQCIIDIVQKILLYFDNAHDGFTDWGEAIKYKFMEIWTEVYIKSFEENNLKKLIDAITMKLLDKFIVKWRNEDQLGSDYLKICAEVFDEISDNQLELITRYFGDNYLLLYKIFIETFKKIEYNRNLNDVPHNVRTILNLCNNFMYQNGNMQLGKFIEEEFKEEDNNSYKVLILFKKTEDTHIEMYYLKIDQNITVTKKKIEDSFLQEEEKNHFIKREFSFMFLNKNAKKAAFLDGTIEIDPNTAKPKLNLDLNNLGEIGSFFNTENISLDDFDEDVYRPESNSPDAHKQEIYHELVRLFIVTININIFNIFNINYGFTTDALGGGGAFIIATLIILYSKNILDIYTAASANDPASSNKRKGNNYLVKQLKRQLSKEKEKPDTVKNDTQILDKIKMIEELKYIEGRKMFSRHTTDLTNIQKFFKTIDENAIEPAQTTFTINGYGYNKLESIKIDNLEIDGDFAFSFSLELVMIQGEPRYIYRISILQKQDNNAKLLILGTEVKSRGPSKTYLKNLLNEWNKSNNSPNILDIWANTKIPDAEWILREFSLQETNPTEKDIEKFLGLNSLDDNPEYYIDKTNKQVTKLTIKGKLWKLFPGYMKAHGDWGQADKEIPNTSFDRSFIKNSASFNNSLVYTAGTNSLVSYCSMISISNLKEKNPLDVLTNLLKQCFSSVEDLKNFFRKIQEIIDRLNSENKDVQFSFEEFTDDQEVNAKPGFGAVHTAKFPDPPTSIPKSDGLGPQIGAVYGLAHGGANTDIGLKKQLLSSKYLPEILEKTPLKELDEKIMSLFNINCNDYENNNTNSGDMHTSVDSENIADLIEIRKNLKTQSLEDSVKFLKPDKKILKPDKLKNFLKFLKKNLTLFRKYMTFSKNNITQQLVKYFEEDQDIQEELKKDLKISESGLVLERFKNNVLYSLSLGDLFDLYSQTKSVRYDYLKGILKSHFKCDILEIINYYIIKSEEKGVEGEAEDEAEEEEEKEKEEEDEEEAEDEEEDEDEDEGQNKKNIDIITLSEFLKYKRSEDLEKILLNPNIELNLSKVVAGGARTPYTFDKDYKAKVVTSRQIQDLTFSKLTKYLEKDPTLGYIFGFDYTKKKRELLKYPFFERWLIPDSNIDNENIDMRKAPEKCGYFEIFRTLANGIKDFLEKITDKTDKIKSSIDTLNNWKNKTVGELLILFTSKYKGKKFDGINVNISKLLYPILGKTILENSKNLINANEEKLQFLVSLTEYLETQKRHIFTVNQSDLPLVKLLNVTTQLEKEGKKGILEITEFDKPSYMKPEHQLLYIFYYALFNNNKQRFIKRVVFRSSGFILEVELTKKIRYNLIKNIYKYLPKDKAMKFMIALLKNNILNNLNKRLTTNLTEHYKYLEESIYKLIQKPDELTHSKLDKKVLKKLVKDPDLSERLKMLLIIFLI